jgi:hypothetical protein
VRLLFQLGGATVVATFGFQPLAQQTVMHILFDLVRAQKGLGLHSAGHLPTHHRPTDVPFLMRLQRVQRVQRQVQVQAQQLEQVGAGLMHLPPVLVHQAPFAAILSLQHVWPEARARANQRALTNHPPSLRKDSPACSSFSSVPNLLRRPSRAHFPPALPVFPEEERTFSFASSASSSCSVLR